MWSSPTAFLKMSSIDVMVFTARRSTSCSFDFCLALQRLQGSRAETSEQREWVWDRQMKGWTASWVVVVGVVTYLMYHNCRGSPVGQPGLVLPRLTSSMWMQASKTSLALNEI